MIQSIEESDSKNLAAENLAPWRSPLARAIHRNRAVPFSRYFQLATVSASGSPANRTVVFRGFLPGTNQVMFISDRRSEKITQIQQNPNAEICWYFTKSREQFRLSGQLMLITHATVSNPLAKARTDLWQKLSDNAKRQFSWPQPKAEKANDEAFTSPVTSAKASSTEASSAEASREDTPNNSQTQQKPPKTFCLLCLSVSTVDHLALRGEPQDRYLYEKIADQNWQIRSVNP